MTEENEKTSAKKSLEGSVPALATPEEVMAAMNEAFDYRGDVTVHTADGRTIEGYVFDRRTQGPQPHIRMIPRDGSPRVNIPYAQIARLSFSGRDTAAGKSWETWVTKWNEKKAKGEKAELTPEPLED